MDDLTRFSSVGLERTVRLIAIIGAVILVIGLFSQLILLIILATLIALMLRGAADAAARYTRLPPTAILALITLSLVTALLLLMFYVGPKLTSEFRDLWTQLQTEFNSLDKQYGETAIGRTIFSASSIPQTVGAELRGYAGTVASSTIGALITTFILIVSALYFAISPDVYFNGLLRLFPLDHRERVSVLLRHVARALQWWSVGQIIEMATVGVLTGVGLVFLNVPMALALGVFAGLFTFIPYFGIVCAAIPALLVALTMSWQTALWVLVIFVLSHSLDAYLVAPLVQRRMIHLPPAVSILAMTAFGGLFGPMGIVLGTPIAAALLVIVREAYVGDVLGDPDISAADRPPVQGQHEAG